VLYFGRGRISQPLGRATRREVGLWARSASGAARSRTPAGRPSGKLLKRRLRDPYWAAQGRAI